jgi:dienelactone hydrolase
MARVTAEQVLAAVAHARTLPWVDATRWVAMGASVGGLATLSAAARRPQGLVAAINFVGGAGGNPEQRPGDPCSPQALEGLWREQAAQANVPMLWLYWANDRYWGAQWPQRWARAWREGGGSVEFHVD